MRLSRFAVAALVLASGACKRTPAARPTVRVAAAADLALAFKEVGAAFEKQSDATMSFSFGSTGLLAKQIQEGAPFDVFAAANQSFVDDVVKSGVCDGSKQSLYARGRIVIWTRKGSTLAPKTIADLADPKFAKIAIANPDHAPYGRAAQDALEKAGVWDRVRSKMVYGENVQQTLQFAQSGNAEAAIVALSLAMATDGDWVPVDPALHRPLDQAMVICGHSPARAEAEKFTAFVSSPDGRAIMRRFGFILPGEQGPPAK
jgi:molybdate transport system substrate-binding protein